MLKSDYVPTDAVAVTPSDTTEGLGLVGFYVGVAGDVKVTTEKGTDVVFKACPAGLHIYLAVSKVFATGTTATDIVGLKP